MLTKQSSSKPPVLSEPRPTRAQLQRKQANSAYKSLHLTPGTFDAQVSALFIKHWVAAVPDKSKGQTKTGLAIKAVEKDLPAVQATSAQVKGILDRVVKAIKDAFVPFD